MKRRIGSLLAILACNVVHGEPLARLFFTPQERAALDAARNDRAVANDAPTKPTPPSSPGLAYSGLVRARGGVPTIWVNGRPLRGTGIPGEAARIVELDGNGAITVRLPQHDAPITLKIGQAFEPESGRIVEGYARRAPTPEHGPAAKRRPRPEPEFRLRRRLADDDRRNPVREED